MLSPWEDINILGHCAMYYSHVDESGVECVLLALLGAGRALLPLEFDLLAAALAATVTVTVHFYCACRPRTSLEIMHMKS